MESSGAGESFGIGGNGEGKVGGTSPPFDSRGRLAVPHVACITITDLLCPLCLRATPYVPRNERTKTASQRRHL